MALKSGVKELNLSVNIPSTSRFVNTADYINPVYVYASAKAFTKSLYWQARAVMEFTKDDPDAQDQAYIVQKIMPMLTSWVISHDKLIHRVTKWYIEPKYVLNQEMISLIVAVNPSQVGFFWVELLANELEALAVKKQLEYFQDPRIKPNY